MFQNLRDLMSNRKFAIPLIVLLGICFIGLLLLGFALILPSIRSDSEPVADVVLTQAAVEGTETAALTTPTEAPTQKPTPRPSPTLVPVGTSVGSGANQPEGTAVAEVTSSPVTSAGEATTATAQAAASAAPTEGSTTAEETPTSGGQDEELADTGIGWGLIFVSGGGLAAVAIAARRLRMAG